MLAWALTAGLLALAPPGEAPRGNTVLTQDRGVILGVAQTVGAQIDAGYQILAGHLAFLAILVVRPRGLLPKM